MSYQVTLGTSESGNITRIDNTLEAIAKNLENSNAQLATLKEQLETTKSQLGIPFPQEQELKEKMKRLAELNAALNIDENGIAAEEQKVSDKKPSVIDKIKKLSANQKKNNPKAPIKEKKNEIS